MLEFIRRLYLFSIMVLVLLAGPAAAQENTNLQDMKKQLEQMRQMMQNMQNKHAAEIEALQKRIKELESRPAGLTKKDRERIGNQKKIDEKIDSIIEEAKKEKAKKELEALRNAAKARAAEKGPEKKMEETVFKAGSIGQQALNPEISVAGDMFYRFVQSEDEAYADHWTDNEVERSAFIFRTLDFHVQSYLDPYSRFKAAVEVDPEGTELDEGYFTRFGVLPDVNVTAGKFNQQFGVVNRWHVHSLDQVNFPLPIREIFGPDGLNQTGVSIDWRMPKMLGASQELTFQVTNASNERLFTGEFLGWPAGLVHYKNYRDLSKDTYLELGATGLFGPNSRSGWRDELGHLHDDHGDRATMVLGADATLFWEPTEKMKYRNLLWRTEFFYLNKHVAPFDDMELGQDTVEAYGAYSYIQTKIVRTIDIGFRADMYRPDTKDYFIPHFAYIQKNPYRWQIGPYITWQQSPWVKFRLEYNHLDGMHMDPQEDRVFLQCVFTAGPHKHDRY